MADDSNQAKGETAFRTAHWRVVLAARSLESTHAHAALTRLCDAYLYPLNCCVRRHGRGRTPIETLLRQFEAQGTRPETLAWFERICGLYRWMDSNWRPPTAVTIAVNRQLEEQIQLRAPAALESLRGVRFSRKFGTCCRMNKPRLNSTKVSAE